MAGVDPGAPVCDSWRSDVGWITTILSSADPQLTLEADPGIGVKQSSTSTTLELEATNVPEVPISEVTCMVV